MSAMERSTETLIAPRRGAVGSVFFPPASPPDAVSPAELEALPAATNMFVLLSPYSCTSLSTALSADSRFSKRPLIVLVVLGGSVSQVASPVNACRFEPMGAPLVPGRATSEDDQNFGDAGNCVKVPMAEPGLRLRNGGRYGWRPMPTS